MSEVPTRRIDNIADTPKRAIICYQGNPPERSELVRLSRRQFFEQYGQPKAMVGPNPTSLRPLTIPPDTICCDGCNGEPLDFVWVLDGSLVFCYDCFIQKWDRWSKSSGIGIEEIEFGPLFEA